MTWLKRIGIGLAAVIGLLVVAGGVLVTKGAATLTQTFEPDVAALAVASDSATVARGAHLAATHGCQVCHGTHYEGAVFLDIPPFRATATNLTGGEGGIAEQYATAADWDRAIRHGVRPDGTLLVVMPSESYHKLADGDAAALIAYLQQLPPANNVLPATEWRLPGKLVTGLDATSALRAVTLTRPATVAPPVGPTAEYGRYLAAVTCQSCHGDDYQGKVGPDGTYASDLRVSAERGYDAFAQTLRTGIAADGHAMDPHVMPWAMTAAMTDDELTALHRYLSSVKPRAVTDT
ncbi:MAG: c-type cytochrome [Bacteroidota bacterium]